MKTDQRNPHLPRVFHEGRATIYVLLVLISTLYVVQEVNAQDEVGAVAKYDVIEIKPLAGSDFTRGIGIADSPIVAFNSYRSVMGISFVNGAVCEFDAAKPAKGCKNTDLGVLGAGGLGSAATMNAISRNGQVAVGIRQTMDTQPTNQAFCVNTPLANGKPCNGLTNLANIAGGNFSNALGITVDDHWITVGWLTITGATSSG
jgi:hypothetical protein